MIIHEFLSFLNTCVTSETLEILKCNQTFKSSLSAKANVQFIHVKAEYPNKVYSLLFRVIVTCRCLIVVVLRFLTLDVIVSVCFCFYFRTV